MKSTDVNPHICCSICLAPCCLCSLSPIFWEVMEACNHKQQTHQAADGYIGPHTMNLYPGNYFPGWLDGFNKKKKKSFSFMEACAIFLNHCYSLITGLTKKPTVISNAFIYYHPGLGNKKEKKEKSLFLDMWQPTSFCCSCPRGSSIIVCCFVKNKK